MTPARRFPDKAIAVATEDRSLGVDVARAALRLSLEEVEAGAQPRVFGDEDQFFDPATSFGAVHACYLLAWHRGTEAADELAQVVALSDRKIEALLGDMHPIHFLPCLDHAGQDALLEWAKSDMDEIAESGVHDAILRRALRGELDRDAALSVFEAAIAKHRDGVRRRLQQAALAFAGLCTVDESGPVRALYDEGLVDDGLMNEEELSTLPLGAGDDDLGAEPVDPRKVGERKDLYAWEDPPPPKKKPKRKKPKKRKPKRKK